MRMQKYVRHKPLHFQLLCMALCKYDFFNGPRDWEDRIADTRFRDFTKPPATWHGCRERYILNWARWVVKEKRDYKDLVRQYFLRTRIPDALDLMIDFST